MSTSINGILITGGGGGGGNVTGPLVSTVHGIPTYADDTGTVLLSNTVALTGTAITGLSELDLGIAGVISESSGILSLNDSSSVNIGTTSAQSNLIVSATSVSTQVPILLPTTGGTPGNLSYYEQYNVTFTWTGIWATNPTNTVSMTRIGNVVTLTILSGIFNPNASISAAITAVTTIPARMRPLGLIAGPITIIDNGSNNLGLLLVQTSGVLLVYTGYGAPYSGSSTSGGSGFFGFTISYVIS